MRIVFYFKTDSRAEQQFLSFRYQTIQAILKGFLVTLTQRAHTFVSEAVLPSLTPAGRQDLILPINGYRFKFSRSAFKEFCESKVIYSIYFHNLPVGECEKLHCYLLQTTNYLGSAELILNSSAAVYFSHLHPCFKISNKRIVVIPPRCNMDHDLLLIEIIRSLPFESWSLDRPQPAYPSFLVRKVPRRGESL
jgi:hypothetical protein